MTTVQLGAQAPGARVQATVLAAVLQAVAVLQVTGKITSEQIENIFSYHAPKGNQPARYEEIRAKAKELATIIMADCPDSDDRDEAIKHLRMAVMFANASIAINE